MRFAASQLVAPLDLDEEANNCTEADSVSQSSHSVKVTLWASYLTLSLVQLYPPLLINLLFLFAQAEAEEEIWCRWSSLVTV